MATQAIIPQPTGNPILDNPTLKAAFMAAQGGAQQPLQPQGATMPPAGQQPPPQISTTRQGPEDNREYQQVSPGNAKGEAIGLLKKSESDTVPQISLPDAPMPAPTPSKQPVVFGPFGQKSGPVAQRGTQEGDEQERERLLSTGSGLSQIHSRIESAMPNHPVLGKIAGIGAQGLATLGDIGLHTISPMAESMIPGTAGHHAAQLGQVNQALTQDIGNTGKEAETAERGANTGHLQEETAEMPGKTASEEGLQGAQQNNLENPAWEHLETDQGIFARNPKTNELMPLTFQGKPLMPKPPTAKGQEHISLEGPGGKPIAANYHPDTGKYSDAAGNEIANPQPYEKPNVTNVNMGNNAKLNDRQQATATAILEGRMTPPSSFALKTPYWQDVMGSVFEKDPQFSEQRAQLRKNFATGSGAIQINAINTALGHVGVLGDAIDALQNGNIKALNNIANQIGVQTGNDAQTTYNTIVHRLGPEITKAYVGAGGTEGDRGTNEKDFEFSLGPKQLKSNVGVTAKLFRSKISSLENQWNQNKSAAMPDFQNRFIMPQAQQTLQRYAPESGNQPAQGGAQGGIPNGATHTVPGSDGKMHYTDGKKDLGVVK